MRNNPLGDVQAERDHRMLDEAFYETPEYLRIIADKTRRVIVGRRGSGKSALFYKLKQQWSLENRYVVELVPTETEVIGLRLFISYFGEKPSYLRAASAKAWEYAIINEIISKLMRNYKARTDSDFSELLETAIIWRNRGDSISSRLFNVLEEKIDKSHPIEKRIGLLAKTLEINILHELLEDLVRTYGRDTALIADRLDEGYEPDPIGVAILTGLIYAFNRLSAKLKKTTTIIFLRDNIFRAIQIHDPDYSRNIEGDVLRLHWNEYHLLNLICSRLRIAFSIDFEKNLRVWDKVTARDLKGMSGFRRCIRLTLFRPRDLLVLLNKAMNNASGQGREVIVNEDVEVAAREISFSRLDDLKKEYRKVLPGIGHLIAMFIGTSKELTFEDIGSIVENTDFSEIENPAESQTLEILNSIDSIVHTLYSVGFLGIWEPSENSFVFCHDGKAPDFSVKSSSRILIHPCYWIALSLKNNLDISDAVEDIHDEYEIQVRSETPGIIRKEIDKVISQLENIPEGLSGASEFEDWCLRALSIVFTPGIVNAELHPNKNMTQRRDIVARNTERTETWRRILHDYGTRQVIFEAKNFIKPLGREEYRQLLSYLCDEYGRIGFIVTRGSEANLGKNIELKWVREIYHKHDRKLIVKLPANLISKWLRKLQNPSRHDTPDRGLGKLLDMYERNYISLG